MDLDPEPAIFVIDLEDANKVFLLITFCRHFFKIVKDKESKRSHKILGIKVFLTIFA